MASEAEMMAAILKLLPTRGLPEAMGQVVKENRDIMLNPAFLQYCRSFNDEADNERMHPVERFLQNAIDHDVDYAINQEKRIFGQIFETAKAYLAVEANAAPAYAKQHQSILLSEEGIRMVRLMVQESEYNKHIVVQEMSHVPSPQEDAELTLAIFRLKLYLLEVAPVRGINTASREYVQGLQELRKNP